MKRSERLVLSMSVAGLLLLLVSFALFHSTKNPASLARRAEKVVSSRMKTLDNYIGKALDGDPYKWLELGSVPEDMVIYRYADDSLHSWCNQFTVFNDDIRLNVEYQYLVNPMLQPRSPLAGISDTVSFINMGPNWYLVKSRARDNVRVIGGLRIDETDYKFRLDGQFSIKPLDTSEGQTVYVDGQPQFKIVYNTLHGGRRANLVLLWLSLALIIGSAMLYLYQNRTVRRFSISSLVVLVTMAATYFWGLSAPNGINIFSPTVYADGDFLYSLGALFIMDLTIILMSMNLYMVRDDIMRRFVSKTSCITGLAVGVSLIVAILFYVNFSLTSIVINSDISLEIYRISDVSAYTILVYFATIGVLICIMLFISMMQEPVSRLLGKEVNFHSAGVRVVFSSLVGIYMVILTSTLGLNKEADKIEVWASRLGFERDIALEVQLRMAETQIANDVLISSLSLLDNTEGTILNRICESYLPRLYQNYDIRVVVFNKDDEPSSKIDFYNERIGDSEPVSEGSRFFYSSSENGQSSYTGLFHYYSRQYGITRVMLCVDPIGNFESNGYASILERVSPGKVLIPTQYSYAKYKEGELQVFRGDYAYPTIISGKFHDQVYGDNISRTTVGGYLHFFNRITDDDTVIISRPADNFLEYLIAVVLVALVAFLLSYFIVNRRNYVRTFEKNYYRQRITAVLMTALLLTLVCLTVVSVLFVYKRNSDNLMRMMSDRINAVQAMIQTRVRGVRSTSELGSPEMYSVIEMVSKTIGTDITLFSPGGQVFMSTVPEFYEMMLLDNRIAEDAYNNIVFRSRRYYINKVRSGQHNYYNMYAPLINSNGSIIAIICSPYSEEKLDFRNDAIQHSMAILTVFLLLLLMSRFMAEAVVDRMFKPLLVMGRKMSSANLESLEQIEYDRDDEITTLVNAYNRMVIELSESTRRLAQAERDKAWSGMARQVAHEIKNPLTPMKLQIQRIMRLKAKGDPRWEEMFDEVMKVLLDHIDILSDTANEFSTFAKLYSEEPTLINLDKVIKEEISMFDNRDNIRFDYYGLEDAKVMGPKPQLTRVFVNLINNAVQAIDEAPDGHIVVSLRNSGTDGFYDIVFEDNGPGVAQENIDKLFTPNFTTKSSGSGLGLAISRSILEKCGATIRYHRSYALGGACFTIVFPK